MATSACYKQIHQVAAQVSASYTSMQFRVEVPHSNGDFHRHLIQCDISGGWSLYSIHPAISPKYISVTNQRPTNQPQSNTVALAEAISPQNIRVSNKPINDTAPQLTDHRIFLI